VFGLTATYVSMLRGRARRHGSAGLVRRRGRPPKLGERQVAQVRRWARAGEGRSQAWIAARYGVARSVVSRLLAQFGPIAVQPELGGSAVAPPDEPARAGRGEPEPDEAVPDEAVSVDVASVEVAPDDVAPVNVVPAGWPFAPAPGLARISTGSHSCRYAGAMLLHAYLDRVGAAGVFATLTGGPARRYHDLAVLTTATLAFALGVDTVEGPKHLRRAEAGAAVGLGAVPELRTLRERLSALADGCDPLALQRAFATAMLATDPAGDPV